MRRICSVIRDARLCSQIDLVLSAPRAKETDRPPSRRDAAAASETTIDRAIRAGRSKPPKSSMSTRFAKLKQIAATMISVVVMVDTIHVWPTRSGIHV